MSMQSSFPRPLPRYGTDVRSRESRDRPLIRRYRVTVLTFARETLDIEG
jgi:hypothetical protein